MPLGRGMSWCIAHSLYEEIRTFNMWYDKVEKLDKAKRIKSGDIFDLAFCGCDRMVEVMVRKMTAVKYKAAAMYAQKIIAPA